jgi:hypothetical protein
MSEAPIKVDSGRFGALEVDLCALDALRPTPRFWV